MTDARKQDEMAALVHWTYSRDEWRNFMRWKKRKKGFFHYLVHRLFSNTNPRTPAIKITANKVCIDDLHEPFHSTERRLQSIDIHDAGKMNVMKITYQRNDVPNAGPTEIQVLVPKGRLKEAIGVEEKLNQIRDTNLRD